MATIGPASSSEETLSQMLDQGMNLARINFSHGTHESNGALIDMVKKLREEKALPVGIVADLQGPRVRIILGDELDVKEGEHIAVSDLSLSPNFQFSILNFQSISNDKISNFNNIIKLDKKNIIECIEVGNEILIEDGKIKLKVTEKKDNVLLAKALVSGTIKNHKGVNIPDAKLNFGALTEKDLEDLEFALSKDVDFVAISFVGGKDDILALKEKIKNLSEKETDLPKIISKVERKKALENIDEIVETSDAIMVARGDLGIEMPESKVVIYQKEIIEKCLASNKPVIVATQMLESMIENPLPTRAEVSDVSNAVIDHTDCVMLSGESANGKYPVEAVRIMAQIIKDTEDSPFDDNLKKFFDHENLEEYRAVIDSAHELAKSSQARAIFMFSFSGATPLFMSQHRPKQEMLLATQNQKTFYQSSILWGVEAFLISKDNDIDDFATFLSQKGAEKQLLEKGDKVVLIMGKLPDGRKMRLIGIEEVK